MPDGRALVLGGGGVAGIAWMTGVLTGLAEAGQDVTGADVIVGTSAGAAVAAQVGSGLSPGALFARQVDPALQAREIPAELDMEKVAAEFAELLAGATSAADAQRRVGAYALAARTVPEAGRRAAVGSRLPSPDWPARRILLVAVDAETGEMRVFDRQSGVDLVERGRRELRRPRYLAAGEHRRPPVRGRRHPVQRQRRPRHPGPGRARRPRAGTRRAAWRWPVTLPCTWFRGCQLRGAAARVQAATILLVVRLTPGRTRR